jgi:hypothetical protein
MSKVFIHHLADWIGNFVELEFKDFEEMLDEIAEDAATYASHAEIVTQLHWELYKDSVRLGDEAATVAEKLVLEHRCATGCTVHKVANRSVLR